ncbi:MAG: hypothetical protein KDK70_11785 [Myxococcales bacterium]|nr:hypothetical protein [Myxococcales bacterium]
MNSDPIRLLDDPAATPGLRSDLTHAADVGLEGLDHAAGLARLKAATGPAAGSSGGLSTLAKVGLAAVATATVAALWLGIPPSSRAPAPASEPASGPAEGPIAQASVPATPSGLAPVADATEPALEARDASTPGVARPEAIEVEAEAVEAEAAQGIDAAEAQALDEVEAEAADAVEAEAAEAEPSAPTPRRRRASKAEPADAPGSSLADASADDVLREARLVARARSSLASDPARALSLTQDAEEEFPRGQLVEERQAIAVQALVALGRHDQARRQGAAFLARFSHSAHAAAVRRALSDVP